MNKGIPNIIGGAEVIYWTEIDERHKNTGKTTHYVGGEVFSDIRGLAICHYESEIGFYLFYCDDTWKEITDTYHETIEDAIDQVEFEYLNGSQTLIKVK